MDIIIETSVCAEPIFQTGDDFSGVQMESGTHLGHILAVIKFLASLIELFYLIENFITTLYSLSRYFARSLLEYSINWQMGQHSSGML